MTPDMPDTPAADRSVPTAPSDTPLVWAEAETRCCVCLRPFPTKAEIERHAEVDCPPPPQECWCWAFCWVEHGGDCDYPVDLDDDLAVFLRLRATEAYAGLLPAVTTGAAGAPGVPRDDEAPKEL